MKLSGQGIGNRFNQWSECLKDIVDAPNQGGAVADEVVAAFAGQGIDRPGERKHLAALFHGVPRGVQSAAFSIGLDDDHTERESADDSVALGEEAGDRLLVERGFRHDGAGICDFRGQLRVFGGVDIEESRCRDGNGASVGAERGPVCDSVDAAGQAANDCQSGFGKSECEVFGLAATVVRATARADNGDRQSIFFQQLPATIEDRGRVVNFLQSAWVGGLFLVEHLKAVVPTGGSLLLGASVGTGSPNGRDEFRSHTGYGAEFVGGGGEDIFR